jgi:hypothetical protein
LRDDRIFLGGTAHLVNGDRVLGAFALGHLDGPWSHPDDFNSYNGTVRYSHGDQKDGFDLTAMAYHGSGNFTTDQPVSAYQQGLIGRFGTLDPSDGNFAERFSLSGHYYVSGGNWNVTTTAYAIRSRLTLWNDFTHFLVDPIQGDQEQQDEPDRSLEIEFEMGHPVSGLDQGRPTANARIGEVHAILRRA